ncbi:DUF4150 domain-containing protein (plasmid) [Psychrobacter sp. KFRI-CH2-11]|uniref:DUF4150 domain-containing protein n=1 Tax=Psychrobacter sp. KFRI-CH2-11 TaxID=3156079 RepID=UPI00324ADC69
MSKTPRAGSKATVLMAISNGPSFNYTSHKKDAIAGYTLYSFIDNAEATAEHTFFNGQPAYLLDQTTQPKCFGDAAGRGGGVKSGTIGGEVKPTSGSSTIFIEGKALIREGDTCTMNNGNVKGKYVTVDASEAYDIMAKWADEATAQALKDGGFWAMSELIYQAEADALWINVKGDEKAYYEGLKKIAARDMVALDILTLPAGLGVKSTQLGFKTGQYVIRSKFSFPMKRVVDSAKIKRAENYKKFSPNWSKGSLKDSHEKFTPNAEGVLSKDGVKTRYTSDSHTIIKDNENNYFRIYDNTRKQYVSPNGKPPPTGGLKGKEAKDHMQKQTHLRNTD